MNHYVNIGKFEVARETNILKTVVGSCIALCMYDKTMSIGGMVHIMLPNSNGNMTESPGKYADTAVQALLDAMIREGSKSQHISASVFGGASMFEFSLTNRDHPIGIVNFMEVQKQLKILGIQIIKKDIGGTAGRKIVFDCKTGKITYSTLGTLNKSK